ncbi:MAG: aldo/keto reductase [Labilibaculum sp.]|nr:aldo/keto reductase [Labilibaculum sp.]
MKEKKQSLIERRDFLKLSAAVALGLYMAPFASFGMNNFSFQPQKRKFGKIDFNVTTLGLGGQAALQLTPEDTDPVAIILKAINLGINFLDASNLYGSSQLNYAKAFRQLNLIPGEINYEHNLRESIFLNSKSCIRWAKGNYPELNNVFNRTNGEHGGGAIADLKRALSQMFGDGQGNYPDGAYLDMFMVHNVNTMEEIDVLYKGLETPLNKGENFGALVALRDYRDGTSHTGLNPKHERLIRHLGFSGHSTPAMIELIQRDVFGLLEGMLAPINVNDRLMFNMQHNVIPVATAKNMAVIGMKVFADGVLYGKEPRWSMSTDNVLT